MREDEVGKALKIHKANLDLQSKNEELKGLIDKYKEDINTISTSKNIEILKLNEKLS